MPDRLLAAEPVVRLGCFLGVLALVALWELLAPRRTQSIGRLTRWPNNLGIVVVDTLALRLLFPTAAVGLALAGEARGWGLLNNVALPSALKVLAAVVLLDLAICLQHRPVPRRAGALAAAPHAPRRSRVRRHHRRALPPGRDRPLDAGQARRGRGARYAGAGCAAVRGAAERD